MAGHISRTACFGLSMLLGACTTVRIQVAGRDDVEVRQMFGIASVEVKGDRGAVYESAGFGISRGIAGLSIGYQAASVALLPPERCQFVVWISSDGQVRELENLLRGHDGICVFRPNQGRGK